ncbi:F0F1 ATP synthase subunit B [Lignipirellula cremea]|uniref:ATP synthase subunit b n=1 Tax=Lignipirellula cremea TaxID=2528010 RepID=A0A518E374_9BACT|nr:F0F1 ATP synthase subunit B [Lignipirellula cremea]QDU98539.1 ATP synthase subunit b [Lignipirellula cremea]
MMRTTLYSAIAMLLFANMGIPMLAPGVSLAFAAQVEADTPDPAEKPADDAATPAADPSHDAPAAEAPHEDAAGEDAAAAAAAAKEVTQKSPLAFDPDLAIVTLIIFLLLVVFLGKFAWGPIMTALDQREKSVADQLDQARRSADKADQTLKEYQAKLAAALEEAKQIGANARKDAEIVREKLLAEAQEAAARERQRAIEDIRLAKESALQELAQKSVDQAVALAGGIIRRELKAGDHSQLIREALEQFPSKN